ncbi:MULTISPECIES: LCP family protein [unclassified Picosynechococcus]|uniref:LCP family protein n=2 Tax=Cyanophyceae TaxID=3028117 RepID=UPI00016DC5E1|nr:MULTISPECIES: LCP family protein [unclassified Picosynechococcus]ACA98372.1 Cell envelope-related transcriptional attenuator, LytR domain [Picosynechococcus sp. PCC 7002]SMH46271.1 transcriptional attenuator, LytR family [Picosynechococcus sp. OG1]
MVHGQEVTNGDHPRKGSTKLLRSPRHNLSRRHKPKSKVFSPFVRGLSWGVGFMGTILLSASLGTAIAVYTPIAQLVLPFLPAPLGSLATDGLRQLGTYSLGRPVNVLVMGVDRVEGTENPEAEFNGRSDTILLVRFEPEQGQVNMLSIPRDSQVRIPNVGITKINEANAYGGGQLAAQVVSDALNGVAVDRYVRLTTDTFKELVDAVGGVNVFVPADMQYTDQTQGLEINLEKGWQVLDGEQAEQFVRFRQDQYGDIGRVQRQQILLKALREKIQSPAIIPRLPALIGLVREHIDTNLTWEEMLALMNFSRQLEPENFQMVMLPGRFSDVGEYNRSYWIISDQGKNQVMTEFFAVESPVWSAPGENDGTLTKNVRIAIQNASGSPGMARQVSEFLQTQGFTNIYLSSDYPDRLEQTQVIAQQGNVSGANQLLANLGTGRVEASSIGEIESDFTIRVGQDWLEQSQESFVSN